MCLCRGEVKKVTGDGDWLCEGGEEEEETKG